MMGRIRRCLRGLLLLFVVLNLGDAPYVDEVLADAGDSAVARSAAEGQGTARETRDERGAPKHADYENRLTNHPMPAGEVQAAMPSQPGSATPQSAEFFVPFPPVERLERPPRRRNVG